nr:hypothetical protein [Burkholderiaceae bacterium]
MRPDAQDRDGWRGPRIDPPALGRLSPFVQRALDLEVGHGSEPPARLERLNALAAQPWTAARLQTALDAAAPPRDAAALAASLRRLRRQVMLALIARDT